VSVALPRFAAIAVVLFFDLACGGGDEVGKDRFGDSPGGGGAGGGPSHGGEASGPTSNGAGPGPASSASSGGGTKQVEHCFDTTLQLFPLSLTDGDGEFNGHGPSVTVTVDAEYEAPGSVRVTACVDMKETQSDWTTGHLCKHESYAIDGLIGVSEDAFEAGYVDHDHELDTLESSDVFDASPLVASVRCQGDHAGNDICSDSGCARCQVELGCIQVQLAR
jgi:hypothetical protein